MIKIGIECENLEDPKSRWGIGQLTLNLLKEYAENPEWQKQYRLYLYFKKRIPDDKFLKNPFFIKRVLGFPSFNIFYHILMPIRAMLDSLDWMFFPSYMLPPLYIGKSIVMLTEDAYYEYKSGTLPFRYRLAYGLFTNWAALRATKILAISETSKKNVARLYKIDSKKIFVAHPGVSVLKDQSLKTKALGFRPLAFSYLLYVGQMFPRRHVRETILAFKKLVTEHSNILKNIGMFELKLILVGKDRYPTSIISNLVKNINQELGGERIIHYEYLEKRSEIENLYAGAKALIYVSDREAFGLPPMEALAFGVPPIIMNNELGHELFGNYAFYAKGSGPENIAGAVLKVFFELEKTEKIKIEGPEFVKKHSWKNFANIFFENVKN